MEINRYIVIEARTLDALSIKVSEKMRHGWVPTGSLIVRETNNLTVFLQPMIFNDKRG